MEQQLLDWTPRRPVLTVTELSAAVRDVFDRDFGRISVAGEISGVRLPPSGHYYFTLKDAQSQIKAVCYKSSARYLKFRPSDGVAVIARGRLDLYAPRGDFQFVVETLEPQGAGALQLAFEQLKKRLALEGLFAAARKRPLPRYPRRIGLVTSPSGAVVRDLLTILGRRFPGLHIRLYPALVQGDGSVEAVCRAIEHFSRTGWAELVIVARGGGSLEDLWTFNEERVARAIAASRPPVISAVGHETDFTIADFVADLRAPTPSAAAELAVLPRAQVIEAIEAMGKKLTQAARFRIAMGARRLHAVGVERSLATLHRSLGRRAQRSDELDYRLRDAVRGALDRRTRRLAALDARLRQQDIHVRFVRTRKRLEEAETRLLTAMRQRLFQAGARAERTHTHLAQLSPLTILDRGYALVRTAPAGVLVKSPTDAPAGTNLEILVASGKLGAIVTTSPKS